MKPLYVLKIGGSVATYKNRPGFSVRRSLLKNVADQILAAKKKNDFDLILIHGAGGYGHFLAKKYELKKGTGKDKEKLHGALLSRCANQKLNGAITDILVEQGLSITPVHTASVIVQENQEISSFDLSAVQEALENECIPLLYGDMVFDKRLGMTVCSGDAIAPYLADKFRASRIIFASDIAGMFTCDPYLNPDAKLVENISFDDIQESVSVSHSHNVDVTGGLLGKINQIGSLRNKGLESVEIFDGLNAGNYKEILTGENFPHTKIFFK